MSEIVDRDTFLYYLNNADVNWEATARECIAKGFELAEENKKLKEKLEETRKQVIRYRSYYCKGCYEITEENEKLKEKLEKIKHIMNVLNNVGYYKDLEKTVLQIIEGAEE